MFPKLFVKNLKTNNEEEIIISNETIGSPGASLMQKNTNTNKNKNQLGKYGYSRKNL